MVTELKMSMKSMGMFEGLLEAFSYVVSKLESQFTRPQISVFDIDVHMCARCSIDASYKTWAHACIWGRPDACNSGVPPLVSWASDRLDCLSAHRRSACSLVLSLT